MSQQASVIKEPLTQGSNTVLQLRTVQEQHIAALLRNGSPGWAVGENALAGNDYGSPVVIGKAGGYIHVPFPLSWTAASFKVDLRRKKRLSVAMVHLNTILCEHLQIV